MRIAIEAAKFTAEEANGLRRAMATFRNVGTIGKFEDKMVGNMIARGYDPAFAKSCFDQIKGFGSYGFPESHAASFAQLVYISSWLKHYHPDAFCCGLLNSQPMGFYAPAQIVGDARKNGVKVREVDVSYSFAQNTLEEKDGRSLRGATRLPPDRRIFLEGSRRGAVEATTAVVSEYSFCIVIPRCVCCGAISASPVHLSPAGGSDCEAIRVRGLRSLERA